VVAKAAEGLGWRSGPVDSGHPVLDRPPSREEQREGLLLDLGFFVACLEPLPHVGRSVLPYLQSLQMLIAQFILKGLRRGSVREYIAVKP